MIVCIVCTCHPTCKSIHSFIQWQIKDDDGHGFASDTVRACRLWRWKATSRQNARYVQVYDIFIVIILQSVLILLNHSKFEVLTFEMASQEWNIGWKRSKPIQHEHFVGWAWECWMKNLLTVKDDFFFFFLLFLCSVKPIQHFIQHDISVMLDEMLDRFNKAIRKFFNIQRKKICVAVSSL